MGKKRKRGETRKQRKLVRNNKAKRVKLDSVKSKQYLDAYNKGSFLYNKQEWKKCIPEFQEALELADNVKSKVVVSCLLGYACMKHWRLEDAVDCFCYVLRFKKKTQLTNVDKVFAEHAVCGYIAYCYKCMKQPTKAIKWFNKQIKLDQSSYEAYYELAEVYRNLDDNNKALKTVADYFSRSDGEIKTVTSTSIKYLLSNGNGDIWMHKLKAEILKEIGGCDKNAQMELEYVVKRGQSNLEYLKKGDIRISVLKNCMDSIKTYERNNKKTFSTYVETFFEGKQFREYDGLRDKQHALLVNPMTKDLPDFDDPDFYDTDIDYGSWEEYSKEFEYGN